jgi:hypothetical protein
MKTNTRWIKTDYWVQSALGLVMVLFILSGLICGLFSVAGFFNSIAGFYYAVFLVLLLFIPIGLWQVISGITHVFQGDKLQKIYLSVVGVYIGIVHLFYNITDYQRLYNDVFLILMGIVALVIAVWKYTVVRADFISLDIIDISKIQNDNLLDA